MFTPKYTITPIINSRVAEIERLKTLINQAVILPELEVSLRFRATVEGVHSSTSIEGNPLNQQQVQKVLQGKVVRASEYAIQEVLNYKKALDWLLKYDGKLTAKHILKLHGILMQDLLLKEKVGVWRPGPIYIVDETNGKEEVQYTGPDANNVPKLIHSFLQWIPLQLKDNLHPVLLAGLVHYIFVSIHPFSDGNGRSTRLLILYYLKKWQYDFRDSLSLDIYYLQHRNQYYQALSRAETFDGRMEADITPFLDYFTQGFLESVKTLSEYIAIGEVSDMAKPIRLNQEELTILDYIQQFGSISLKEAEEVLSIPKRTIQRRFKSLVDKRILDIKGSGPSTEYQIHKKEF